MRKIISMLLALCMLCAVHFALAEQAGQVLEDGVFSFQIPQSWEITQSTMDRGISVNQLKPGSADSAMILSIDYTRAHDARRDMNAAADSWEEKLDFHMARLWKLLGGDEGSLRDAMAGTAANAAFELLDEGKGGALLVQRSGSGSTIRTQILIFRLFEEEGYVLMVSAKLPGGDAFEAACAQVQAEAMAVHQSAQVYRTETADDAVARVVVTADMARIRSEQSISGGLIRKATKGETFYCIGESENWYFIEINGRTGYIHKGVSALE